MGKGRRKVSESLTEEQRALLRSLGSEGGKIGGPARWEGRTAEEKSAHARHMVEARERKRAERNRAGAKKGKKKSG